MALIPDGTDIKSSLFTDNFLRRINLKLVKKFPEYNGRIEVTMFAGRVSAVSVFEENWATECLKLGRIEDERVVHSSSCLPSDLDIANNITCLNQEALSIYLAENMDRWVLQSVGFEITNDG